MMLRLRRHSADLLHLLPLIVLPLLWFGPVLFTSKTLLPYDNLYQFQPWRDLPSHCHPQWTATSQFECILH